MPIDLWRESISNITENVHANLSNVAYSGFLQYVLQILKATNAPEVTLRRIQEKFEKLPTEPIHYFDRAIFSEFEGPISSILLDELIAKLKKKPLLVFCISKNIVCARNTRTNEEVKFRPGDISAHLHFMLPLIQGIRGQVSNQETWKLAELITVLKNELIRDLDTADQKALVPAFILDLIKASIANYFSQDLVVTAKLKLVDNENHKNIGKKYSDIISPLEIGNSGTKSILIALMPLLDSKTLGLIKSVFLYDYSLVDSEIIGSLIYRVVSSDAGTRSHMVSEENALKFLTPMLIEPYLIELTKVEANSKQHETLVERILDFTFLDPTNGTGNLLASAMNQIITFISLSDTHKSSIARLKIENFTAINEDPIGAEISRIIIWFAYINLIFSHKKTSQKTLIGIFRKTKVIEENPLKNKWEIDPKNQLPDFIFGVPTFKGWHKMSLEEKNLFNIVAHDFNPSNLDFSSAWLVKASKLIAGTNSIACFGLTNSITQGKQVQLLWPKVLNSGVEIAFAYPSFKWLNDPKQNTGVTAVIIGLRTEHSRNLRPTIRQSGQVKSVNVIGPYLVDGITNIIRSETKRMIGSQLPHMVKGNMPYDDGNLLLTPSEKATLLSIAPSAEQFIKRIVGSDEFINSIERYCLWIPTDELPKALAIKPIAKRIAAVKNYRLSGSDAAAKKLADKAHQFREFRSTQKQTLVIPSVSSENRRYIPMGFVGPDTIVSNLSFAIYECEPWVLPVLNSAMHMVWATTTCGNLETRIRYSSQLCYNTFPLPDLSQDQRKELTKFALALISCREKFPDKSLGELYSRMPIELEEQHITIDQYVDGIYGLKGSISNQDRLRKLLEIYTK